MTWLCPSIDVEDSDSPQWNFIASLKQKFGDNLGWFAGGFFSQYVAVDMNSLPGVLDEPLHNFEKAERRAKGRS